MARRAPERTTGRVRPADPTGGRRSWSGLAVMALFGLWASGLGAAFAVVVATSYRELGLLRIGLFTVVAAGLLAAGLRTLYEFVRRVRG